MGQGELGRGGSENGRRATATGEIGAVCADWGATGGVHVWRAWVGGDLKWGQVARPGGGGHGAVGEARGFAVDCGRGGGANAAAVVGAEAGFVVEVGAVVGGLAAAKELVVVAVGLAAVANEGGHKSDIHFALELLGGAKDEEGEHRGRDAGQIAGDGAHGALVGQVGLGFVQGLEDIFARLEARRDVCVFESAEGQEGNGQAHDQPVVDSGVVYTLPAGARPCSASSTLAALDGGVAHHHCGTAASLAVLHGAPSLQLPTALEVLVKDHQEEDAGSYEREDVCFFWGEILLSETESRH